MRINEVISFVRGRFYPMNNQGFQETLIPVASHIFKQLHPDEDPRIITTIGFLALKEELTKNPTLLMLPIEVHKAVDLWVHDDNWESRMKELDTQFGDIQPL